MEHHNAKTALGALSSAGDYLEWMRDLLGDEVPLIWSSDPIYWRDSAGETWWTHRGVTTWVAPLHSDNPGDEQDREELERQGPLEQVYPAYVDAGGTIWRLTARGDYVINPWAPSLTASLEELRQEYGPLTPVKQDQHTQSKAHASAVAEDRIEKIEGLLWRAAHQLEYGLELEDDAR